jgi:hypothetical protein
MADEDDSRALSEDGSDFESVSEEDIEDTLQQEEILAANQGEDVADEIAALNAEADL